MTPPLHVAFFNRSFHPDTTATGQLLTELCESLVAEHGWRVSVVTGMPLADHAVRRAGGWVVSWERYRGIDIVRGRGTRLSKRRFSGRFANYVTYFLSACYAGLRLDRPDVVVALTDPPIIGLAAYLASWRFGAPLVMAYKDIFPEVATLLEDFHSDAVNRVLHEVNRFLVRRATLNLALGETMKRRLVEGKGADPVRTRVIPDWMDTAEIVPGPRNNEFARAHGLVGKFVVMHSGNMGLSQGLEGVIEAAACLQHVPDIRFVFVGDGVKRPAIERQVAELGLSNVVFLPYQPKERLRESFAAADVFVVSLKAGLAGYIVPSKLYGILAAARPYVAAVEEECEVAHITREYECGLLAEPGKPRELADRIVRLYHDRALARKLGENARRAAAFFDRPVQVAAYHETLLDAARRGREGRGRRLKRAFDVALSGVGLVGAAPLFALIALAIKLDDGGPVFYRQKRVGEGGRLFDGWKFRSMIVDADARFGPLQAREADSRVTRVGRLFRATAMDELPQLWNILRGEMSFVGPRALLPTEIEVNGAGESIPIQAIPGYEARHRVPPGLTGLAQVYADRDIPRRHKFRYDLLYIRRRRFPLDLRLILLSFWITFRGRWERRGRKF